MPRRNRESDNGFERWGGYMEAKKSKLDEQFRDTTCKNISKLSDIFSGVSIFVNGYTNPSSTELKDLMAMHSGTYHHYYRPSVTKFVIASNLPDVKIKSLTCKVVRPEWITDCVSEQRLLDYSNYLLYTNENATQPQLSFKYLGRPGVAPKSLRTSSEMHSSISYHKCNLSEKEQDNCDTNASLKSKLMVDVTNTEVTNINVRVDNIINLSKTFQKIIHTDKAKTAIDPHFLTDFYNNSRLHHIATLGAAFKQHITKLRLISNGEFIGRKKLRAISDNNLNYCRYDKVIMHIDMDCFFVSVGLRTRPELRGHPVAVAHAKGIKNITARAGSNRNEEIILYNHRMKNKISKAPSEALNNNMSHNTFIELDGVSRLDGVDEYSSMSEIASCSYEARSKGIKNGMFLGAALKLCPDIKTIPYEFEEYKDVAYTLYNTVAEYTLDIEGVSCDEMFVDITQLLNIYHISPRNFADHIRSEIKTRTGCPCSTGFGSNKLQARLATRRAKPDGYYFLQQHETDLFMENVSISDLPGVGYSTTSKLVSKGFKTCGELLKVSMSTLQKEFGLKCGENLYNHCRGIDNRPLIYEHIRKSVSAEINYGIRFNTVLEYETFLKQLSIEVTSRLKEINQTGRCITLKLMARAKEAPEETAKYMGHGVCDNFSKSQTLQYQTNDVNVITSTVLVLAKALAVSPSELRGIGIQISRLESQKVSTNNSLTCLSTFLKRSSVKYNQTVAEVNQLNPVILIENKNNIGLDDKTGKKIGHEIPTDTNILNLAECDSPNLGISLKSTNISSIPIVKNVTMNSKECKISPVKRSVVQNRRTKKVNKSKNKNSLHKFLSSGSSSKVMSKFNIDFKDEIDPEVLAMLPEDIRQEVFREYKIEAKPSTVGALAPLKINQQFLAELPIDIRKEIENQLPQQIKAYENGQNSNLQKNALSKLLSVKSINNSESFMPEFIWTRDLLREWIKTETIPEQCDVDMLTKYIDSLVIKRQISDVYILMRFLFRIINEQYLLNHPCLWHKAYCSILDKIQCRMFERYNNKLLLKTKFKCDKIH